MVVKDPRKNLKFLVKIRGLILKNYGHMLQIFETIQLATDDSRDVRETQNTCEMRTGYFVFFMLLHKTVSNRFAVEAVIMHETKGFSCAIRDKITV